MYAIRSYYDFKNKDDLLISLFEEKMAEVVADARERVASEDGALSRLKIFIENHMNLLVREAGLIEVLQVELRQSNKFMKEYVPVKFLEYLDVISEILEHRITSYNVCYTKLLRGRVGHAGLTPGSPLLPSGLTLGERLGVGGLVRAGLAGLLPGCPLVITPYYNKPTQDGLLRHFRAVAESADIPLIRNNFV